MGETRDEKLGHALEESASLLESGDPNQQLATRIELWRVLGLQFLPRRRPEEDRHGVVSSAELGDLVDDFVGDSHKRTFYDV